MKKALLFVFIIFCFAQIQAQNNELWQRVSQNSISSRNPSVTSEIKMYYKLNDVFLKQKLDKVISRDNSKRTTEVTFPNANGILERFSVWEASNFEPELQAKYTDIRAYEGVGVDDKTAKIYFSLSPIGLQTMVLRTTENVEFIENNSEDKSQYVVFASKNNFSKSALVCTTEATAKLISKNASTAKTNVNNKVFKTMRLALSCTGEYAQYFGGTKAGALAGMNATMSRVNGLFNRDLALKLILIANNDAVIFTDASTDPYSVASSGAKGAWNLEVQTTLTNTIGNANYDIGHLFGGSGGGGNAGCIGCVCVDPTTSGAIGKGSAYTSPSDEKPQGDTFDIDFVAHEFGHQLGANHTFSYDIEGVGVSVEPGSGSTIMGYAGITDNYNIQNNSDDYFAYASILQIQNNLATKSCPISIAITNNPPTINAGSDYTIPKETAFVLTGTGTDSEGNTITYCWEQNDSASSTSGDNSRTYLTKPDGPMFRSFSPTSSPVRYFPSYESVLQNRLSSTWESVSSIGRTMNFTLTGRDNAADGTAQTNTDAMIVTVNNSTGPFAITSQNTDNLGWINGSQQVITWSVNNTNSLAGSSNVNIKLSTDGGLTFSTILASNTLNDGSETIIVPADVKATNCRLLIEPTANIYYAINSKQFAIGYTVTSTTNTYTFSAPFAIPDGNSTYTTRIINVPVSTNKSITAGLNNVEFTNKSTETTADLISIVDVNLNVDFTHTYLSDVQMDIVSPANVIVKLFNESCGSTGNTLKLVYDDAGNDLSCDLTTLQTIVPAEKLSAFNGESPFGDWTLRIRDPYARDSGTLNSASITIQTQKYTLGIKETENIEFVLYPNPNLGNFTIQFSSDSLNEIKVLVHDILGKKVYEKIFERTSIFNQNIQLPNPVSGVYLVAVIEGDKKTVKKIVIN